MTPDPLQFTITPEQWQGVRAAFAKEGVDVPDEAAGEISQSGIRARFTFDGARLSVTVYDKPFIYPIRVVVERVKNFIEDAIV